MDKRRSGRGLEYRKKALSRLRKAYIACWTVGSRAIPSTTGSLPGSICPSCEDAIKSMEDEVDQLEALLNRPQTPQGLWHRPAGLVRHR